MLVYQVIDYICKKKKFDGYTNEWLDFIVNNRNEELPDITAKVVKILEFGC